VGIAEIAGRLGTLINHNIDKAVELIVETRKSYNQKALLYSPSGDDSPPVKGDRLVLVKVDGTGKYIVVGTLTQSQGANPGEKILFARKNDGGIVSKFSMLNDGTVKLEGEKDLILAIKGSSKTQVEKDLKMTVKGNITFEGNADSTHKTTGKFTVQGGTIEILADTELILKAIGASGWCPNGLTNCCMTGAPHGGAPMGITGLKGNG